MDNLTKGTWVANSVKKLAAIRQNASALQEFEATDQAGKAGMLLARLLTEEQEIVPNAKVKAFARESSISPGEFKHVLDLLRTQGKVDYNVNSQGVPDQVETYCFSSSDALSTTASIFDSLGPGQVESGSLEALDLTFHLPRTEQEVLEALSQTMPEKDSRTVMDLQEQLRLVRVSSIDNEKILYNEYAFADDGPRIALALRGLDPLEKQTVEDVLQVVSTTPGQPLDSLERRFPADVLTMMQGVGLLDVMPVYSQRSEASFVTTPHLKGINIGTTILSADVFHKAKALLNCLRYGQYKSAGWRGEISSGSKMTNIINKLNRGDRVGPCTAIGQDYVMLETLGVITTFPATGGMFYMELRQKEVGLLVSQMLVDHRARGGGHRRSHQRKSG